MQDSLEFLKSQIVNTDILKSLFPNGFTMPEIQKVYETILGVSFDRRNFRKKLLSLGFAPSSKSSLLYKAPPTKAHISLNGSFVLLMSKTFVTPFSTVNIEERFICSRFSNVDFNFKCF